MSFNDREEYLESCYSRTQSYSPKHLAFLARQKKDKESHREVFMDVEYGDYGEVL